MARKCILVATIASVLLIFTLGVSGTGPISQKEIIQKAWEAMFGDLKKKDLKSIYIETHFPDKRPPCRQFVQRPDRFRNEVSSGVLVFDGKKAAWVERTPDEHGTAREPEILDPKHWRHFEMDIALVFPAFFEYPSEFRGVSQHKGKEYFELFVQLPMGAHVSYFLDKKSFEIRRRLVSWDGNPPHDLFDNFIEKYKDYGGIRFPEGYSFFRQTSQEKVLYKNLKVNFSPDEKLFEFPQGLK